MADKFGHRLGRAIREMRGAKGLTQAELVDVVFDDVEKVRILRDLENGRTANPQARTYIPLCDFLEIDVEAIRSKADQNSSVSPAYSVSDLYEREIEAFQSVEEIVVNANTFSRSTIELLATRFLIAEAFDKTDEQLVELLTQRAGEFRLFRENRVHSPSKTSGFSGPDVEIPLKGYVNSTETPDGDASTPSVVEIPFRGRIGGGVPIESIYFGSEPVRGRFVSLAELAIEAWDYGEIRQAMLLYQAARNV